MKGRSETYLLIFFVLIFSCAKLNAQKTITIGNFQFTPAHPSVCNYTSNKELVENYWEVKNDSFYTYDVWYTITDNEQLANTVIVEAGAIADIDYSLCEMDTGATTDSTCEFSIFLYDNVEGASSSFCQRRYTKDGMENAGWTGILLIFCDDPSLFDKIKKTLAERQKR